MIDLPRMACRRRLATSTIVVLLMVASSLTAAYAQNATQRSSFVGNTFSNGHIVIEIQPSAVTVLDSSGRNVIGQLDWEIQTDISGNWQPLPWDSPRSMAIEDVGAVHRVTLKDTVGSGQLLVSIYFEAKPTDAPYVPLRMPVDIQELSGLNSYRLVWHLNTLATSSVSSFQFRRTTTSDGTPLSGLLPAGHNMTRSPSGENSMVGLAQDGKTVLIGLNWDAALGYYQGAVLSPSNTGTATDVTFGSFTLSTGQMFHLPACPCPDGGGGGGGSTTYFYGHVYIAGTTTGIYGATVNIGGLTYITDSTGYYIITVPAGGTYNAIATAFGYCQSTASLTVSIYAAQYHDFSLSIWDTAAFEPHGYVCGPVSSANTGWYNLRNDYGSMSPSVIYSRSTSSNSISIVTTSSGETGAPTSTPSGDSKMIRMYGSDDSPYGNGYAYTYFYLKNVNIPLSSPMYLAFNIYSYTTPYNNGHVSVDAHFTDGSNLRDNVIDGNHYVTDNFGHRIHPALEQLVSFPYERPGCCVIYPGGWIRVVADLTEIRYKTIDYLMVAYDNGQTGGTGQSGSIFQAYFDDIRFIMPNLPANTINGGFEGSLYGWGAAGTSGEAPRLSSGPCNGNTADSRVCTSAEGSQSVLIGPDPKYTGPAAGDSYLVQTFRVPNDPKFLGPSLTFSSAIATLQTCACTTNDWASVTLRDRTTLQDVILLKTVGTYITCTSCLPDGVGWTTTTFRIDSLKGHLLWLIINVHNDASGLNTWAWFDGIRIVPLGMTITENSPSAARVKLDPSVYRGTSDTKIISGSFSSTSTTSVVNGNAGIQVGIDLRNFSEASNSPIPDDIQMATSINAWASGGTSSDNSGNTWGPYFIKDASLTVTVTLVSGDNHFSVTYVETWGFNLNPVAGFDQVEATIIALGVLLLPFDALSLIIPVLAIPTFVAGTTLTGADVVYNSQHTAGTNGPSPSQTQNWAFPSGPCNAFGCPPPPFRSNPLAGGTAYSTVYLGGVASAGGIYDINVQGKADIGQDYCSTNGCFTSAFPISTSYDLTVWTVTDVSPVASFTASTYQPYPNNTVTFDASNSYDPDGYLTSYHWDFGDGTTGSGQTVSHVYKYAGGDTVTLTVTDNAGLTASQSQQVVVQHCC